MDFSIASILMLDGITNGAIYALLALATVLVFAVTRVIFIPQGEFVAYGALTMAGFQLGKTPGTAWFLLAMAGLVALLDAWVGLRSRQPLPALLLKLLRGAAAPALIAALAIWAGPRQLPLVFQAGDHVGPGHRHGPAGSIAWPMKSWPMLPCWCS